MRLTNILNFKQIMFLTGFFIAMNVPGQDSHLSQYYASPMLINPALTGMNIEAYRGHLHYRNQWRSIVSNPFLTQCVAFDMPYKEKFGFGGYILNNRAGAGHLNSFNFFTSAAYEVTIDPADIHHLLTGVQLGLINKSVNVNELYFENQYTTQDGGGFDPNISSGEVFDNDNVLILDANFGVFYFNRHKLRIFDQFLVKTSHIIPYYVGVSGFHLWSPKETFLNTENRLPLRIVGYGGMMYRISNEIGLEPNFLYMYQAGNHELQSGIMGYYYVKESDMFVMFGPYYRHKDALIIHLGCIYKEYTFRLSYDINMFSLRSISGGRGGIEISFTYMYSNKPSSSMLH